MAAPFFSAFLILSATFFLLAPPPAYGESIGNILYSGQTLQKDQWLQDRDSKFQIGLSGGLAVPCTLVLTYRLTLIWLSKNNGTSPDLVHDCYLSVPNDGNLVLYNSDNIALWTSKTIRGQGDYVLILRQGGVTRLPEVVLYGSMLWTTETNQVGTSNVTISSNSTEPVVIAGDNISMVTDTEK